MSSIKFYLDEDVNVEIATALNKRGFDAVTTKDVERLSSKDPDQLDFTTLKKRVIITYNIADYAKLHYQYLAQKKRHYGIIVTAQITIGKTLQRLINLASQLSAEDMINRLEFLSNWK